MSQSKPSQPLDPELLAILACPETHQALSLADAAVLEGLNARIEAGTARTAAGATVEERVEAGLLREDRKVLYPIRDAIPVLLVDEGIDLEG